MTWRRYYNTDLRLIHYSQLFLELIKEGVIKPSGLKLTVTYHDPCDLGRGCGIYHEPRAIMDEIKGVRVIELEKNRALSTCCGGGGNLEMADPLLLSKISSMKLEQIKRTGADTVVSTCQQCLRTIKTASVRTSTGLNVIDLSELLFKVIN
jgi:heterodisulfide reductase subunit D